MALNRFERLIRDYARVANSRLYQLEKAGLTSSAVSNVYINSKTNKTSFRVTDKGNIRFRTDLSQMTRKEQVKLKKELNKFLNNPWSQKGHIERAIEKVDEQSSHVFNLGDMSKKDSLKIYNSVAYQLAQDSFGMGSDDLNNTIEELSLKGMNKNEILNWLGKTKGMTTEEFERFKTATFNSLYEKERDRREYDTGWNESGEPEDYRSVYEMFTRGIGDR